MNCGSEAWAVDHATFPGPVISQASFQPAEARRAMTTKEITEPQSLTNAWMRDVHSGFLHNC